MFYNTSISRSSPLVGAKFIFKDAGGLELGNIILDTQLDSATYVLEATEDYLVELLVERAGMKCYNLLL